MTESLWSTLALDRQAAHQAARSYDCPFVNTGHPWFMDPCQLDCGGETLLAGDIRSGLIALTAGTWLPREVADDWLWITD